MTSASATRRTNGRSCPQGPTPSSPTARGNSTWRKSRWLALPLGCLGWLALPLGRLGWLALPQGRLGWLWRFGLSKLGCESSRSETFHLSKHFVSTDMSAPCYSWLLFHPTLRYRMTRLSGLTSLRALPMYHVSCCNGLCGHMCMCHTHVMWTSCDLVFSMYMYMYIVADQEYHMFCGLMTTM